MILRRWQSVLGGERGGVALFIAVSATLVLLLGAVLIAAAVDVGVAAARAQNAADAAALAGVGTSPLVGGTGEPCAAARHTAAANGADLERCSAVPGESPAEPLRVEVEVHIATGLPAVRLIVPHVAARAAAAVRPQPHH